MAPPSLEELFSRYRERGDAGAFSELYDKTATEVLRVAMFLSRDAVAAEDLVQATYFAAIEGASGWDRARPVLPWLLGILANQARWRNRRESRVPDAERVARPRASDPVGDAQLAEFTQRVDDAVASLGELYRPVLVLHLKHGFTAPEIAHTLGRPPATIRTQLARGLELLKKALPPSLALSAFVALAPTRGLAAIKQVVVTKAGGGVAAAGVGIASTVAGAMLMKKVVAVLACAMLAWVAWIAWPDPVPGTKARQPQSAPAAAALGSDSNAPATRPASSSWREPVGAEARPATGVGSLRCRVLWEEDRTPAAGVFVHVVVWGRANPMANTVDLPTDARGELALEDLEPGSLGIYLDRGEGDSVTILPGQRSDSTILIARGIAVDVLVADEDARPIANAHVWLSHYGNGTMGHDVGLTDAAGRFTIRDVGEARDVSVRATGFRRPPARRVKGKPGERIEVAFALQGDGGAVAGLVRAPDGRPCPEALVEVDDLPRLDIHDGPSQPPPVRLRTLRDGTFAIEGLPPCKALLRVRARGAAAWEKRVEVRARETTRLEVPLAPAAGLRGVIRDDSGAPLARARVGTGGRYGDFAYCQAESDREGKFSLVDLAPGQAELRVLHDDCIPNSIRVGVEAGATSECAIALVRSRQDDQIRGRVVDDDERPLVGWHVESMPYHDAPQWWGYARTDGDGRFVHKSCQERDCRLQVYPPDREGSRFPVLALEHVHPGGGDLLVRVPKACLQLGSVAGVVRGADGQPLKASVTVMEPENQFRQSTCETEADGSFVAGSLPPHEYSIWVRAAGHPMLELRRVVERGQRLDLGVISLVAGGKLRLSLKDAGAGPKHIGYAAVREVGGRCSAFLRIPDGCVSDPLLPGRYRVTLDLNGYATTVREVDVRDGEITELEVAPERGAPCRFGFAAVGDAKRWDVLEVSIVDARGAEVWSSKLERLGLERLPSFSVGLAPGGYRCLAKTDTGLQASASFAVADVDKPQRPVLLELR